MEMFQGASFRDLPPITRPSLIDNRPALPGSMSMRLLKRTLPAQFLHYKQTSAAQISACPRRCRQVGRARSCDHQDALSSSTNFNGSTDEIGFWLRGELYRTGFDASWEIDVFGGMHRLIEAAHGDLEATAADGQHVLVSLLAEVALNYVEARTFQTQLQAAEDNLKTQAETLQLTEWRLAASLVSQLDVEQAKANLESTRSQLPRLRSNIETVKNRLAILLGVVPGTLNTQLEAKKPIPGRHRKWLLESLRAYCAAGPT